MDFWSTLHGMGWEMSRGQGAFSTVYLHPNKDYILKLFEPRDVGYIRFLTLALQNQDNPHFPRLRGRPVRATKHAMAIRLERLQPISQATFWRNQDWLNMASGRKIWRRLVSNDDAAQEFLAHWPRFADALDALNSMYTVDSGIEFDWHPGNMMQRGDVPVIIDPFKPHPKIRAELLANQVDNI
jgi:hypothetical protein